jgi:hypothetical protein
MKLLGFKKWYEGKTEKQSYTVSAGHGLNKIGDNIYKFPQRMLQIEMDVLTENVNVKNSKNKIDRYFLSNNADAYSQGEIKSIKKILAEGKARGNHFFLLGYDFTSGDPRKCLKNSLKSAEGLKKSFEFMKDIPTRGLGRMEKIHENYFSHVPTSLIKQGVELIECYFDPSQTDSNISIPFYFNPNDYSLLEKYKGCLKGILIQSILKSESLEIKVLASKPWTSSKKKELTEKLKSREDSSSLFEMKYPNPSKSSLLYPQNKPMTTVNKISVKELTERRAKVVVDYLELITAGMPINYLYEGLGYVEGNPILGIEIR